MSYKKRGIFCYYTSDCKHAAVTVRQRKMYLTHLAVRMDIARTTTLKMWLFLNNAYVLGQVTLLVKKPASLVCSSMNHQEQLLISCLRQWWVQSKNLLKEINSYFPCEGVSVCGGEQHWNKYIKHSAWWGIHQELKKHTAEVPNNRPDI